MRNRGGVMLGTKPTEAERHPQPLVRACRHPAASSRFTEIYGQIACLLQPVCCTNAALQHLSVGRKLPDRQAVFLLFLHNVIQQDLVLRFPGMPNMANKPSQSHPTRQQILSGLSQQLQQCLPTSTASRLSPVLLWGHPTLAELCQL